MFAKDMGASQIENPSDMLVHLAERDARAILEQRGQYVVNRITT